MVCWQRSVLRLRASTPIIVVTVATEVKTQLTDTPRRNEWTPAFSPDGLQIAFGRSIGGGQANLWIADADGSNPTRITDTPDVDEFQLSWQAT
jgi:Tol biopolymer transport system component